MALYVKVKDLDCKKMPIHVNGDMNQMWILINSKHQLADICYSTLNVSLSMNTFELFTRYTSIPHSKL